MAERATSAGARAAYSPPGSPSSGVILSNDLAGDSDGLFSTVRAVLSPSVSLRGVGWYRSARVTSMYSVGGRHALRRTVDGRRVVLTRSGSSGQSTLVT